MRSKNHMFTHMHAQEHGRERSAQHFHSQWRGCIALTQAHANAVSFYAAHMDADAGSHQTNTRALDAPSRVHTNT